MGRKMMVLSKSFNFNKCDEVRINSLKDLILNLSLIGGYVAFELLKKEVLKLTTINKMLLIFQRSFIL